MYKINKKLLSTKTNALSKGKVMVVGDVILDEFIEGSPERISREAPVLILEHMSTSYALGGASNAANNISSYGARCVLVGIVGSDSYSKTFVKECKANKIIPALTTDRSRPTTVKTRISSIAHKHPTSSISFKQQVLRLDRLKSFKASKTIENKIISSIKSNLSKVNTIIISDYELGICTENIIQYTLTAAKERKIKVIIDSQAGLGRFKGAFLFTPNQPDTEDAVGFKIKDKSSLLKAGKILLELTEANYILITRGSQGMALFNSKSPKTPLILPAFNASEVFDVTGAGDTVAGTIATAISCGCKIEDAIALSNLAASLVVKKYGTVTTNKGELKEALKNL